MEDVNVREKDKRNEEDKLEIENAVDDEFRERAAK